MPPAESIRTLSMHQSEPPHHRHGRPRWRTLLALVAATLVLHLMLLGGAEFGATPRGKPAAQAMPVDVRTLTPPVSVDAPVVSLQAPFDTPTVAAAAPVPVVKPRAAVVAASVPAGVATVVAPPAPTPAPLAQEAAAPPQDITLLAEVAAKQELPAAGDIDVPTYRTQLPPAAALRYDLRRGILSGTGELDWKPGAGGQYELRLEGHVAGLSILVQTSQGLIDEAGLAPLRFVDQRRRDTRAANFQRDKGRITFSGPAVEYPLLPGSQDRLSWMVQLGAILNAEPQRATSGAKVAMFIVGARGDGDVWVFRFVGAETVSTGLGPVHAVKFTREPRKPYDTQVEVWLDPARSHLPVRAKLTTAPDGSSLELSLREMQ